MGVSGQGLGVRLLAMTVSWCKAATAFCHAVTDRKGEVFAYVGLSQNLKDLKVFGIRPKTVL